MKVMEINNSMKSQISRVAQTAMMFDMLRQIKCRLIFECFFAVAIVALVSMPLHAEYECENNLECLEKANDAMNDANLDAAIFYWGRDIEIAEELAEEYPEDDDGTYYVYHHAGHMLVVCLYQRARVYSRFNFPERAIDDYSRILEVQDIYPVNEHEIPEGVIYGERAWVYHEIAEYDKAIADNDAAIEILENTKHSLAEQAMAVIYINRGYSYYFIGKNEEAANDLKVAMKLDSDITLAKCVSVEIDLSSGDTQRARSALDRYYEECYADVEGTAYADAFRIIYDELKDSGHFPDAKTLFEQASEAMKNDEYSVAAGIYKACTYLDPMNPAYTYNLALAFALNEEKGEALLYYHRYLYLNPEASDRNEVIEIIDELHPKESTYELMQRYMEEKENKKE